MFGADAHAIISDVTIDELQRRFQQATDLRDARDMDRARYVLEDLARAHPDVFGVWLVLGGVQREQRDYVSAEASLLIATQLRPTSELASLALFHTFRRVGKMDGAFGEMRRFLTLRPESFEYSRLLAEMNCEEFPQ